MSDEQTTEIQTEIQKQLGLHIEKNDPIFAVGVLNEIMAKDFLQKLDALYKYQAARTEEQNNVQFQKIWKYTEEIFKNKVLQTVKELDERYAERQSIAPVPNSATSGTATPAPKQQFNDKTISEIKLSFKKKLETLLIIGSVGVACLVVGAAIGRFFL